MPTTSFRLDQETQDILRILNIPFSKIFKKGLISYAIEGKIRDPRVLAKLKRYQQEFMDEIDAESRVLEKLISAIEKPESDVQQDHEIQIEEVIERPDHISPAMAEALATDKIIPVTFVKNISLQYLKALDKYDGNMLKVKEDLNRASMEDSDKAAWVIVSGRLDLDKILEAGIHQAMRER
jgi:hypothetical protein